VRRDPALSFRGALAILGRHERPLIDRLDRLLGGIILGSGAAAAVTAIGGVVAVPVALLTAVWGWIDQKNEAMQLLRDLAGGLSKLPGW
jgi:hypothetical protein